MKNNFNYNKKILLVILSILFFIFILNFLSADSCSVVPVSSCPSNRILMKLSDNTNAHGELASENNYNYAVCCDFPGESTNNGEDKILGLSSNTNAHAQSPELSTYSTNVYYTGLKDCRTVPKGTAHDNTEVEVVSLYSSTNSHLATVGDYDYTILCTVVSSTSICGDGNLDPDLGETCDDGNTVGGDGCSSDCQLETCSDSDSGKDYINLGTVTTESGASTDSCFTDVTLIVKGVNVLLQQHLTVEMGILMLEKIVIIVLLMLEVVVI